MLIAVPHCQEGTMRLNIKPKQKSWLCDGLLLVSHLETRRDGCYLAIKIQTVLPHIRTAFSLQYNLTPSPFHPLFAGPSHEAIILSSLLNTVFFSHLSLLYLSYLGWKDGAWPRTSWRSKKCHSCFTIWDRHCFRYLVIVVQRAFESLSVLLCSNSLNL